MKLNLAYRHKREYKANVPPVIEMFNTNLRMCLKVWKERRVEDIWEKERGGK